MMETAKLGGAAALAAVIVLGISSMSVTWYCITEVARLQGRVERLEFDSDDKANTISQLLDQFGVQSSTYQGGSAGEKNPGHHREARQFDINTIVVQIVRAELEAHLNCSTDEETKCTIEPGPPGDPGPSGPPGPRGETGDHGAKGNKGEQGQQGYPGFKGQEGERGEMGKDGLQGARGERGEKGDMGTRGPVGEKGERGDTGSGGQKGEKGEKGHLGYPGYKGQKGELGKQGIDGPIGERGKKGDIGPPGPSGGEKGEQGDSGIKGERGEQGEKGHQGYPGHTGQKGEIGVRGPIGEKGEKGGAGPQGQRGDTGLPGSKGEKGQLGYPGYTGDTGPRGVRGERGVTGLSGPVGAKGEKGQVGYKGQKGEVGVRGEKGSQGAEGLGGDKGVQGERGEKGAMGTQGPVGEKGESGDTGVSGLKGEKGDQGIPGSRGGKGEPGPKGEKGDTPAVGPYTYACGGTSGWARVAYLDMTNSDHKCPGDMVEVTLSGKRLCGRTENAILSCVSANFSTSGLQYSQVCGRITGYQYGTTGAFYFGYVQSLDIDRWYVDGVSVTHGPPGSREHVWTFTSGVNEDGSGVVDDAQCPCTHTASGTVAPPYVGQDYFCESGVSSGHSYVLYHDDPLWDGDGCYTTGNTCCEFNNPPYFTKQLNSMTSNGLEVRACGYYSRSGTYRGDTLVVLIELYIK